MSPTNGGAPWTGFFAALYSGCEGLVELRALPSAKQCFAPADDHARLGRFIAAHDAEDLYMGVATRRDATSGALANCHHLGALWADVDFKRTPEADARARLAGLALPPSAIVHSGGGLHCYWFLREPLALQDEADVVKGLLARLVVATGGDVSSAEPAHILRVPGTWNRKPEYGSPRPVRLEALDAAL